jgi:hypothetical protein
MKFARRGLYVVGYTRQKPGMREWSHDKPTVWEFVYL